MVKFANLNAKEIYPLPIDDGYLVYAPLSECMFVISEEDVERMERRLSTGIPDKDVDELLNYIRTNAKSHRTIPAKTNISQIHKLTILPTYNCNFNCSYCYSAGGRRKKELNRDKAIAMIDYFINTKRTDLRDLWLAILGGGEPFLAVDLTADIIRHARIRAIKEGINLGIGLTTNGSIYSPLLSEVMKKNKVSLGVSFEVLEDVQNTQRSHYNRVVQTIKKYMYDGVDITIKSIITPSNVNRLQEMVYEMHRLFPLVKKYKLQIVEDPSIFSDIRTMEQFYKDFTYKFFPAESLGHNFGIDVYVLASKFIDMLIEHYCGGEMCLNPDETITICHRISSPNEDGYDKFVYGEFDSNNILFDESKFKKLISHNITQQKCKDCFVKWHCGGGCFAQSSIYSDEQLNVICNWTRSFTKQILLQRLKENSI